MKQIILLAFAMISVACYPQTVEEQAREAYDEVNYPKVIELLEAELKTKKQSLEESADLYYNLGNAYYRMGELGNARLNYERALLLAPSDADIKHNIRFLETKIEDKIPLADSFFISMWFNTVQNITSSNTWTKLAIFSFLGLIAVLFLFFFTQTINLKKAAFYLGLVFLALCIFSNIFSYRQKLKIEQRDTAIVMAAIATVHSSPDRNSKDVFTLHKGTKIRLIKEDRSWLEIQILDGSIGWIQREKIEII